jgi:hypothetical protein
VKNIDKWPELKTMWDVNRVCKQLTVAWDKCQICSNQFPPSEIPGGRVCVNCSDLIPTPKEIKALQRSIKEHARKYGREINNKDILNLLTQRLFAKRTLRRIKEKIKYESDHTDVHGKQCENEENNEGGA